MDECPNFDGLLLNPRGLSMTQIILLLKIVAYVAIFHRIGG